MNSLIHLTYFLGSNQRQFLPAPCSWKNDYSFNIIVIELPEPRFAGTEQILVHSATFTCIIYLQRTTPHLPEPPNPGKQVKYLNRSQSFILKYVSRNQFYSTSKDLQIWIKCSLLNLPLYFRTWAIKITSSTVSEAQSSSCSLWWIKDGSEYR